MNLIENLKKLESQATPGPWNAPMLIGATLHGPNCQFIAELRTAFPHFVDLIQAAHEAVYNDNQDAQEKLHNALLVFLDDPEKKNAPGKPRAEKTQRSLGK